MFDEFDAVAEDIVHVEKFGVASVCHAMVTDEHDIYNISQIPGFE